MMSESKLTEQQIYARARMKKAVSELLAAQRPAQVEGNAFETDLVDVTGNDLIAPSSDESIDPYDFQLESETWWQESKEDAGVPIDVVYDPSDAPDGPPWRYERTPSEQAELQERRLRRAESRKKAKQKAEKLTPTKLKNPSNLQVRFRTGLIYTLLTIVCVFAGNIPTLIYLMAVAGICAGEFYYMLRSDAKLPNEALGITGAVLYLPATYIWGLVGAMLVTISLLLALLIWYVFWLRARVQDVGISFFGAIYTGFMLCGIMMIRQSIDDPWAGLVVFLLFLSVWTNDAFAYFVGSKIGKHKLAPRTSPKKSWEGFVAGLVGSAIVWVIMSFVPGINMPIWVAILFGIICGLTEVLGDLAESRIKRNAGFKDSGTIMPGHGGLLDRCDSLFLASTTAAILLIWSGSIPYAIF